MGTIREFRTRQFTVIIDAIEDDAPDLSFDNTGEVRAGLESGRYVIFTARARAFHLGVELASDYLGGCIYESLDAFQDHKECGAQTRKLRAEGNAAVVGSYFAGMVSEVCRTARKALCGMRTVKVRCK